MNHKLGDLEARLALLGRTLQYPPTPDIAAASIARMHARRRTAALRRAWGTALLILLLVALLAVPPVRAQILEFIQIGIVRIFPVAPSPTAPLYTQAGPSILVPTVAQVEHAEAPTGTKQPATPTPTAPSTLLPSLLNLAGETTLEDAQSRLTFPILLPTYPTDLGVPDRVFLQEQMLVLVWLTAGEPDKITLSLHIFASDNAFASKWEPKNIVQTHVNGQPAVWVEGPYPFRLRNGAVTFDRLIEGHVLVWTMGDLTYRLETDGSLDEALKIAESLAPLDNR